MRLKNILLPIASLLMCKGIVHSVEYVDTHFMTSNPFIAAPVVVLLLTCIPILILFNVILLLAKNGDTGYIGNDVHMPRTPSWMEFQNYDNLNRIRQAMENKDVDYSNRDNS